MFILLCGIAVLMICGIRVHVHGLDEGYLSKDNTAAIKGIFILIVFLSHARQYTTFESFGDSFAIDVMNYLGQLMVAPFLFYSGYGIYESIKKKPHYIQSMPKNRILKTWLDFAFALICWMVVGALLNLTYSMRVVVLAFTGWTNIGNSNWYMFAIFTLYILTYISFRIMKNHKFFALIAASVMSLGYVYIMSKVQDNYWSSTYLCYAAGLWYSYFKNYIEKVLHSFKNVTWYIATVLSVLAYLYFFEMRYERLMMFNLVAILFCLSIVFLSCKIKINSPVLRWCGNNLFWIYILQRIPMKILADMGLSENHTNIYAILCIIIVIPLALGVKYLSARLQKHILH